MQLVRTTANAWGDTALEGMSWDLLPVAFGLGVLVIVAHLAWRAIRRSRGS
jgi:hypothetical protein